MDEVRLVIFLAIAGLRSSRLEIGAVGDGGDLVVAALSGEPHFDVDRFGSRKRHIACCEKHVAVVKTQPLQNFFRSGEHLFENARAVMRLGKAKELHSVELVSADEAALLRARSACL